MSTQALTTEPQTRRWWLIILAVAVLVLLVAAALGLRFRAPAFRASFSVEAVGLLVSDGSVEAELPSIEGLANADLIRILFWRSVNGDLVGANDSNWREVVTAIESHPSEKFRLRVSSCRRFDGRLSFGRWHLATFGESELQVGTDSDSADERIDSVKPE